MEAEEIGQQLQERGSDSFDDGNPDKSRISGRKVFLWGLLIVILILAAGYYYIRSKINTPLSKNDKTQEFTVRPGEGSRTVSSELYNQGLISSSFIFDLYTIKTGQSSKIQAGQYVLAPNMSIKEIVNEFTAGKVDNQIIVVQIKEGWSLDDIAAYLEDNKISTKAEFNDGLTQAEKTFDYLGENPTDKSLEGYLFPDTYFIAKQGTGLEHSTDLISKALNNFEKKFTQQMRSDAVTNPVDGSGKKMTLRDTVILASIIEREVGRNTQRLSDSDLANLDTERKTVAGIFYNRLQAGMLLQSDATVNFITKKHNPSATYADISIDSPYNTYKYKGLTPGPISSPSLSSLEAAVYPAKTDFLYFLTKPDGTAVFAKTNEEQAANKAKYLK